MRIFSADIRSLQPYLYWFPQLVQFGTLQQTTSGETMQPPGCADLYAWQVDRENGAPLFRQIAL
jgi:hypothetical protein